VEGEPEIDKRAKSGNEQLKMTKQSQITYQSWGFFSSSLELESSSLYVPPALKWKVLEGDTDGHVRSANEAKQSHLMPIFRGFFSSLPPEVASQRPIMRGEDRPKPVGGFSWQILE
jgi:hypothetical protein